jgi:hypothetical protein
MYFTLDSGAIAKTIGVNVWVEFPDGTKRQATPEEEAEFHALQTEYWDNFDREFDGIVEDFD